MCLKIFSRLVAAGCLILAACSGSSPNPNSAEEFFGTICPEAKNISATLVEDEVAVATYAVNFVTLSSQGSAYVLYIRSENEWSVSNLGSLQSVGCSVRLNDT